MVEGAGLENRYTPKEYRGFESPFFRNKLAKNCDQASLSQFFDGLLPSPRSGRGCYLFSRSHFQFQGSILYALRINGRRGRKKFQIFTNVI